MNGATNEAAMSFRIYKSEKTSLLQIRAVEEVLGLYQEKYADFNVRHFHEERVEVHGIHLSYTWVKRALQALQGAGLVKKERKRGVHRKRRPRRPLPGMLVHLDGSEHRCFQDDRWYDFIVILDDATTEVYYAQFAGGTKPKADTSCAIKSGHFHVLTTVRRRFVRCRAASTW